MVYSHLWLKCVVAQVSIEERRTTSDKRRAYADWPYSEGLGDVMASVEKGKATWT